MITKSSLKIPAIFLTVLNNLHVISAVANTCDLLVGIERIVNSYNLP
jgi:hypothetical protein